MYNVSLPEDRELIYVVMHVVFVPDSKEKKWRRHVITILYILVVMLLYSHTSKIKHKHKHKLKNTNYIIKLHWNVKM